MSDGQKIVTRFAPSPTGYLHVGGARTALFCWLYARGKGGQFLLRIEDTDQKRNTPEATQAILDGMAWLGLESDGEIAYQSQRLDLYNEHFKRLIDAGLAYECFMTPEELEVKRAEAQAEKRDFRYQREWARITDEQKQKYRDEGRVPVLRLATPNEDITIHDEVFGDVTTPADQLDDFVIRKSDGFPTYHFAVVVDDATMGVTHVIRGQEHLGNTPRHVALQQALGFERPTYAHLPILLNPDGSKISKRQLDEWGKGKVPVKIVDYQRLGYLPEALVNFLALLGWNPGDGREVMTLDEITASFSLDRIIQSNARFDLEKLDWMNGQYIQHMDEDLLIRRLSEFLAPREHAASGAPADALRPIVPLYRPRARTLVDFAEASGFFFTDTVELDDAAVKKVLLKGEPTGLEHLQAAREILAAVEPFDAQPLEEAVKAYCESQQAGLGKVAQPIRIAVSGGTVSPPIFDTLAVLGKQRSLERIDAAIAKVSAQPEEPAAESSAEPSDVSPSQPQQES